MLQLQTTAGEIIDFAADFIVALPALAEQFAPVVLPSVFVGLVAGAWIANAWHNHCDRRVEEAAAAARLWKMDREGRSRL